MGLYVHIPFCSKKCSYCDFVSGEYSTAVQDAYLSALIKEAYTQFKRTLPPFETVYIGGGSPSSLNEKHLKRLIEFFRNQDLLKECIELTIEMNPSQVTPGKLSVISDFATRISLGVQTFSPKLREILGRFPIQTDIIHETVELIRSETNLDLNLDLIHSIPGQNIEELSEDLHQITTLAPEHISVYGLSLEKGTPLHDAVCSGAHPYPDEDLGCFALQQTREKLAKEGYEQYEISNFSLPEKKCLHNELTWQGFEYIGLGAGACSYLRGERLRNEPEVLKYIEKINNNSSPVIEKELLSPVESAGELAMLNLRTTDGINIVDFQKKSIFKPLEIFSEAIEKHVKQGWLTVTETNIRLTEKGLDFADQVMMDFVVIN